MCYLVLIPPPHSLEKPVRAIPKLVEAIGDRDPPGYACIISGHRQRSDALRNMPRRLLAKTALDSKGFGPSLLFRRHNSVAATEGAERGLFHGSLVRCMKICSSGKQRS